MKIISLNGLRFSLEHGVKKSKTNITILLKYMGLDYLKIMMIYMDTALKW
jgi:hypothetical protein